MTDLLTIWIRRQVAAAISETGRPIVRVRVFRVSARRLYLLIQNIVAGLGQAEHKDPDVILGKEICPLILEDTMEGADARLEHDVLLLRKNLVAGSRSGAQIGYAIRLGRTLFVLLTGSAHARDVDADVPEDERNSLIQMQRELVRQLSELGTADDPGFRLEMHFTEESRMARSSEHAADLLRTLKYYQVRLFTRGTQWDTTDSQHGVILGMLLGQAASDRDAAVYRLVKGKLASLIAGRLPEHVEWHVPFTHGQHRDQRTDIRTGAKFEKIDPTLVAVVPEQVPVLRQLVTRVLDEADRVQSEGRTHFPWDDLAIWASEELGLTSRIRQDPDNPPVLLHFLDQPGLALKRHLSERMIEAWRTGLLPWTTWTECEIPGLTEQLEVLEKAHSGRILVRGSVICPQPKEGWGISDAEWESLILLVRPSGDLAGRPQSGWGMPFVSDTWVSEDGETEYRVSVNTGRYDLGWRPSSEAQGPTGRAVGWRNRDSNVQVIGALAANDLHDSVGVELQALLEELEKSEPLGTLQVTADTGKSLTQTRKAQNELETIEAGIADRRILTDGARKVLYRCVAADDEAGQRAAETDLMLYETENAGLQAEATRLRAQLTAQPAPEDEETLVDVSRLELVAAGLQTVWKDPNNKLDNPGTLPPELAAACRALFRRSLRAEVAGRFDTHIDWTVTCYIPLAGRRTAVRTLTGRIKNSRIEASMHGDPQRVARLYLAEGWTYQEIGDEFHVDGSGKKNSLLLQTLKRYLRTPSSADGLAIKSEAARRAILDSPLELRQAIWAWKENEPDIAEHLDPAWFTHVVDTYRDPEFAWGQSWTASTWRFEREVIGLIAGLPTPRSGAPLEWLLEQVPIPQYKMTRLSFTPDIGRFTTAPGLNHPPIAWRNWDRTDTPAEGKRLFLYECPHPDCPGKDGDQDALIDHVLFVPENPKGLICAHCRRAPDPAYASIPFPESYFQPWRKTAVKIDGTRSHSTTDPLVPRSDPAESSEEEQDAA